MLLSIVFLAFKIGNSTSPVIPSINLLNFYKVSSFTLAKSRRLHNVEPSPTAFTTRNINHSLVRCYWPHLYRADSLHRINSLICDFVDAVRLSRTASSCPALPCQLKSAQVPAQCKITTGKSNCLHQLGTSTCAQNAQSAGIFRHSVLRLLTTPTHYFVQQQRSVRLDYKSSFRSVVSFLITTLQTHKPQLLNPLTHSD